MRDIRMRLRQRTMRFANAALPIAAIVLGACDSDADAVAPCDRAVQSYEYVSDVSVPPPAQSTRPLFTLRLRQTVASSAAGSRGCEGEAAVGEVRAEIVSRAQLATRFDYRIAFDGAGADWVSTGQTLRLAPGAVLNLGIVSRDTTPLTGGTVTINVSDYFIVTE